MRAVETLDNQLDRSRRYLNPHGYELLDDDGWGSKIGDFVYGRAPSEFPFPAYDVVEPLIDKHPRFYVSVRYSCDLWQWSLDPEAINREIGVRRAMRRAIRR